MRARLHTTVGAACACLLATAALAQTGPAPGAGNLDERVRQQLRAPGERERAEALMTGDGDLLLLRRTQLFNAHSSLDLNHTSNAFLAPEDSVADQYAQLEIGVGAATRINDRYDVFADLGVLAVRYIDQSTLDYTAPTAVLGVASKFGPVNVTATYQPSMVFSRDFGDRQLTSHRLRVSGAWPMQLGSYTLQPEAHLEQAFTDPEDYTAWTAGTSVTLSRPLSKTAPVFAYASAAYDRREFDDYFTAFLGLKRKDDNVSAGAGVVWRPRAWNEVRASYSYGHNSSTSDVNRYEASSGTLGFSATLRF